MLYYVELYERIEISKYKEPKTTEIATADQMCLTLLATRFDHIWGDTNQKHIGNCYTHFRGIQNNNTDFLTPICHIDTTTHKMKKVYESR